MRIVQFVVAIALVMISSSTLLAKNLLTKAEERAFNQYTAAARGVALAKVCRKITGNHASDIDEFSRRAKEMKQQLPSGVTSLFSHPTGLKIFEENMMDTLRRKHPVQQVRLCKKGIRQFRRTANMH